MVVFFLLLLLLGAGLEAVTLRDSLREVTFSCEPSVDRVEPDTPFTLTAEVSNRSRLPISYLCAQIKYPRAAVLPEGVPVRQDPVGKTAPDIYRLWGRQTVRHALPVQLDARGAHLFRGAVLVRGDFLGLSQTTEEVLCRREVLVYPRRFESTALQQAVGSYCGDILARRYLLQDPVLTMGVREYTGSEPMKTISWTQSARRGELMVREFDNTRQLQCSVVLCAEWLEDRDTELLDRCCSIARTVCETLTARGVEILLSTNAPLWGYRFRGVWTCTAAPNRLADVLETLARIDVAPGCGVPELADTVGRRSRGTAFVVIAPRRTAQVEALERSLEAAGGMDVLTLAAEDWDERRDAP